MPTRPLTARAATACHGRTSIGAYHERTHCAPGHPATPAAARDRRPSHARSGSRQARRADRALGRPRPPRLDPSVALAGGGVLDAGRPAPAGRRQDPEVVRHRPVECGLVAPQHRLVAGLLLHDPAGDRGRSLRGGHPERRRDDRDPVRPVVHGDPANDRPPLARRGRPGTAGPGYWHGREHGTAPCAPRIPARKQAAKVARSRAAQTRPKVPCEGIPLGSARKPGSHPSSARPNRSTPARRRHRNGRSRDAPKHEPGPKGRVRTGTRGVLEEGTGCGRVPPHVVYAVPAIPDCRRPRPRPRKPGRPCHPPLDPDPQQAVFPPSRRIPSATPSGSPAGPGSSRQFQPRASAPATCGAAMLVPLSFL